MINSVFDLPIYCINLKKDSDRKDFIKLQLINKNVTFIDAVCYNLVNENKISNMQNISTKNFFSEEKMDIGEICCLMSNIKLYIEALKNTEYSHILVIDENVNLINNYNKNADKLIIDNINNYECLQLSTNLSLGFMNELNNLNIERNSNLILDWNKYNTKYNPFGPFGSTGCYIISRQAMFKILNIYLISDKLMPSDYFIYNNLNTGFLIYPCEFFESTIVNSNLDSNNNSTKYLLKNYTSNNKIIFIHIWFGNLPDYFNLWLFSVKNKNFDILFITDQHIEYFPENVKIINMNLNELNKLISKKINFDIELKNNAKLVDLKPMLGCLFFELIFNYEYWGWTDIDMLMGNITSCISKYPDHEIYSFGFETFGPMTIFKTNIIDVYKSIENYEIILNDEYVCKVDEPWWWTNCRNEELIDRNIYKDQNINVKYYKGNNLLNFVKKKKYICIDWVNICVNIDWNINNRILSNFNSYNETYFISDNLYKNNKEIYFCHLTYLKRNKKFLENVKNIKNLENIKNIELFTEYSPNNDNYTSLKELKNMDIYQVYNKFINTNVSIIFN